LRHPSNLIKLNAGMNESEFDGPTTAAFEAILSSLPPTVKSESPDSRGLFVDLQFVAALLSEISGAITQASLIFRDTDKQVRVCAIGEGLLVGRANDCDLSLPQRRDLSRHHFKITKENNGFRLFDHGSSNGTFVRGIQSRIASRELCDGDIIEAGGLAFVYIGPVSGI